MRQRGILEKRVRAYIEGSLNEYGEVELLLDMLTEAEGMRNEIERLSTENAELRLALDAPTKAEITLRAERDEAVRLHDELAQLLEDRDDYARHRHMRD